MVNAQFNDKNENEEETQKILGECPRSYESYAGQCESLRMLHMESLLPDKESDMEKNSEMELTRDRKCSFSQLRTETPPLNNDSQHSTEKQIATLTTLLESLISMLTPLKSKVDSPLIKEDDKHIYPVEIFDSRKRQLVCRAPPVPRYQEIAPKLIITTL